MKGSAQSSDGNAYLGPTNELCGRSWLGHGGLSDHGSTGILARLALLGNRVTGAPEDSYFNQHCGLIGAWSRVFATAFSGFTMFLDGTGNDLYMDAGYTSANAMTGSMRIATMGNYV